MIELFAVGAATTVLGLKAFKDYLTDADAKKRRAALEQNPYLPHAHWLEGTAVPSRYSPKCFEAQFTWPYESCERQRNRLDFLYYVPCDHTRGVIVRIGGGGLITNHDERLSILHSAQAMALRLYETATIKAIAADKDKPRSAQIERAWHAAIDADRERVIAEIRAGRNGAFSRDWVAEAKAPLSADARYHRGNKAIEAAQLRANAIKRQEQDIAQAERARLEAVRKAAADAERELNLKAQREADETRRAVDEARERKLSEPISLALSDAGIVMGSHCPSATDIVVPVRQFQHMLIGGTTGAGKSVFLHQLVYQLLRSDQVDQVVLVDLKGGTEFNCYSESPKAKVLWEFADVIATFDELVALLNAREVEMRNKGLRNWPGPRTFVIIDEYAEIHNDISEAKRGEQKDAANRLGNNLKRIIRRARSAGLVMICALQKPTTDALDSTLRANMNFRACFRVNTRHSVEATLDATCDDLPANPLSLEKGQFVFDDGEHYGVLKTHIAPGLDLGVQL